MHKLLSKYRKGVANIVRWMPLVWRDRDYDYGPFLDLMHFKLCSMADYHEHQGHLLHSDRYVKQMRICAKLCRRLREDNYSQQAALIAGPQLSSPEHASKFRSQQYALEGLMRERDVKLLAYILGRHLLSWWD